ncbi:winged helix-turn-helix domain-containing protein [Marinobacter salexigens]|uniref:Winged helix-turn-helix domain-containing protein n=1 Tax=Marinobacter salexigens TaxID=1925763 RepID=A0ABS6A5H3_9GAMM|nr:winged helix-turn-helix domain-containing protein [Marinobacter salexigens]MBU2873299.1 winged helix-turn-helix domain-containing protein [Marinobacter salexigens]
MPDSNTCLTPRLRLKAGDTIALGPGKAQLLELIQQHRSISAAARAMKMSYRRAWLLVDTMNTCFENPLVLTATGGNQGGGAELSDEGLKVLALYRQYENAVSERPELTELASLLSKNT